jgi:hypothetical protein
MMFGVRSEERRVRAAINAFAPQLRYNDDDEVGHFSGRHLRGFLMDIIPRYALAFCTKQVGELFQDLLCLSTRQRRSEIRTYIEWQPTYITYGVFIARQ